MTTTTEIANRRNLDLANGFINDDVATISVITEVDIHDPIFDLKLSDNCKILENGNS